MEQLVLMKQLQDTNYYVNVCLLSSATVNSLLHLEVWCCAWVFFFSLLSFSVGREHFQWNAICRNAANKKQGTQRDSTVDTVCQIQLFP